MSVFPLAVICWPLACGCGISWSCSLVSRDEAQILSINLPVFLWLFLLLPQVGLWSVVVAFPGRDHSFSLLGPDFNY